MNHFRSHACWSDEVYTNKYGKHISTDDHVTEQDANNVCIMLEKDGFGGDGKDFPIETWVTPIPFEEQYPEEAEVLMDICEENAKNKRNKPFMLDATEPIQADEKVGRNDPCPCGSGKKYKKCCI